MHGEVSAPLARDFSKAMVSRANIRGIIFKQNRFFLEFFIILENVKFYRYYILKAMLESTVIKWTVSEIV